MPIVNLEIMMSEAMARDIQEKGLAEIVLRRADSKFRAMEKCKLIKSAVSEATEPSAEMQAKVMRALRDWRKSDRKISENNSTVKNMSVQVDRIFQNVDIVRNFSYLNTGLSVANLAVDIAGFAMVMMKLNELNSEIQKVAGQIEKVSIILQNGKVAEFQRLTMRFNVLSAKLQDGEPVTMDEIESLQNDMTPFLLEMIMNLHHETMDLGLVLNIIHSLLPAHTILTKENLTRCYLSKQKLPPNYESYLTVFDGLETEQFRKRLQDYYFFDEKLSSQDTLALMDAQSLIGLNGKVQIMDQEQLLRTRETPHSVEEFDMAVDNIVKYWASGGLSLQTAAAN